MNFTTDDNVTLYYEDSGSKDAAAVIFAHEFAGEVGSWDDQIAALKDGYRCVAYAARGWLPSEVPEDPAAYSIERAVADMIGLMDHLELEKAHVVGLSMGSNTTLQSALWHPERCHSLTMSSSGYGAMTEGRAEFQNACHDMSARLINEGWANIADTYGDGPFRRSFKSKHPEAHADFVKRLSGHSSLGSALTQRGIQARRPSFVEQEAALKALTLPTLLIVGDDDHPGFAGTLYLKQMIATAGLYVSPRTGHQVNLEEPEVFNHVLRQFLSAVSDGSWGVHPDTDRMF